MTLIVILGLLVFLNKLYLMEIVLDSPEEKVSDLIGYHIEKFIEVAKEFFIKAKNTMRLRMLLSPHGVQENMKKSLLHFFISKSFKVFNQQYPLYIIVHQLAEEEFRNFRYSPIGRGNSAINSQPNLEVTRYFINVNYLGQ